jgi:ketosteroid isomerase-like protein
LDEATVAVAIDRYIIPEESMHFIRFQHPLPIFAVAFVLVGCTASPPPFDAAAESAKLMQRDSAWSALATEGKDIERIVSYWSDDAVVMEPGQQPVEGKQAIRAMVTQSVNTPGFKIHWVSQKPTFSPDGKMAYMRGTDEMTVPGPKGAPMTLHLQGYSIWRKDADGQWRCTVDVAGEQAPPPAATTKKGS